MGFLETLSAMTGATGNKEFNQNVGLADKARVTQGYQTNGLTDREANELAQRNLIAQRAYEANLKAMQNAPVVDGKITPAYWDAAQKASNYEMSGLAGSVR